MISMSTLLELVGFAGLVVTLAIAAGPAAALCAVFVTAMVVGHLIGDL